MTGAAIKLTHYGVEILLAGYLTDANVNSLYQSAIKLLTKIDGPVIRVLVDCRHLQHLTKDAEKVLANMQSFFKAHGLERSVVVLSNNHATLERVRDVSFRSGVFDYERYLSVVDFPETWFDHAIHWLLDGKEPPDAGMSRADSAVRRGRSKATHVFIRHGKGFQLELKLEPEISLEQVQMALMELNLSIEDQVTRHSIRVVEPSTSELEFPAGPQCPSECGSGLFSKCACELEKDSQQ